VARSEVEFKKSALKQLRKLPKQIQTGILKSITTYLVDSSHIADGKHIKKLTGGYRLRYTNYRIFYYINKNTVMITSIVRRTSTTY